MVKTAALPTVFSLASPAMLSPQATVIMTALNIKCAACGAKIKNGLVAKFGSHVKSVSLSSNSP